MFVHPIQHVHCKMSFVFRKLEQLHHVHNCYIHLSVFFGCLQKNRRIRYSIKNIYVPTKTDE